MNKTVLLSLALMALGCSAPTPEDVTELEQTLGEGTVTLVRASKFVMSRYGMSSVNHSYTVLVDNLAYDKSVVIWGQTPSGWQGVSAQFVRTAGDNQEIWEAYTNSGFDRFAVKVEMSGQTYWDNNGGSDYAIVGTGVQLYNDVDVLQWGTPYLYPQSSYLWIAANLRNLSYDKQVDVVYTTDHWSTVQVAPLSYGATQYYGYGWASSPNDAGVEYWTGAIDVGAATPSVEYAIAYEAGDETRWDNDFGANYVVNRQP
jgi:hypothetical protein